MSVTNPGLSRSIISGSYTGNDGAARQILTGFHCSLVIISMVGAGAARVTMIPDSSVYDDTASHNSDITADCYLHPADGFVVGNAIENMNLGANVYYYWAISE